MPVNLHKMASEISGITKITNFEGELHLEIASEQGATLKCALFIEEFGFDQQKELRLVLSADITTTKEAIAQLVERANPFVDIWYADHRARLNMHEEFISITMAANANAEILNQAVQKITQIRAAL